VVSTSEYLHPWVTSREATKEVDKKAEMGSLKIVQVTIHPVVEMLSVEINARR